MELINKDTPQVKEFISSLDSMLNGIETIVKHYKPHLNGECFLSNHEVTDFITLLALNSLLTSILASSAYLTKCNPLDSSSLSNLFK